MTAVCKLPCSHRRGRSVQSESIEYIGSTTMFCEGSYIPALGTKTSTLNRSCPVQHWLTGIGSPYAGQAGDASPDTTPHCDVACLQDGKGAGVFCFLGTDSSRAGDMVKGQMKWVCSC